MYMALRTAMPMLALSALAPLTACAQPAEQAGAAETVIGEWTMTTLEARTDSEYRASPYSGQVVFTDSGTLSVQAMNPDTEAPDTDYTLAGYEAYYGPVTIDSEQGTFEIEVESALARDLIGRRLTRNFEVTDDTLVITAVDANEGWRVTYERES